MNPDLYRELYKFEWEQRAQLLSAVNIPIVAITALSTVLATVAMGYPYSSSPESAIFKACTILATIALIVSLVLVLCSLLFIEYQKLPSLPLLRQHYKDLTNWYITNGKTEDDAKRDFQSSFDDHLAIASEINGKRNRFRGNCIFLASVVLGCSLLPLGTAGGLYVSASVSQPEKIYKVRVHP